MATVMQWIHVMASIVILGDVGFLLLVLLPSLRVLNADQREALSRAVTGRFRWTSWSAMVLLLASGLINVRRFYWEEPWDRAWKLLTAKILLSFGLFGIILGLTIPFGFLEPMRARRRGWLIAAFTLGVVVVLISAYLRRG